MASTWYSAQTDSRATDYFPPAYTTSSVQTPTEMNEEPMFSYTASSPDSETSVEESLNLPPVKPEVIKRPPNSWR